MNRIGIRFGLTVILFLLASCLQAEDTDPQTGLTAEKPTVFMLSTDGCGWCVRWKNDVQPWVQSSGQWKVEERYGLRARIYPTFRIWTGKRWLGHEGYMDRNTFRRLLKGR